MTRVALVSEPSRAVVHEGRLRTVSWWAGRRARNHLARLGRLACAKLPASGQRRASCHDSSSATVARGSPRQYRPPQAAALGEASATTPRGWRGEPSRDGVGGVGHPAQRVERRGRAGAHRGDADGWHRNRPSAGCPHEPATGPRTPSGLSETASSTSSSRGFSRRLDRGSISHVSISRDGIISDPETVLDPGVHASYPFLVEHDGATFMLPETSAAAGELVLYEAVSFPLQWRRAATLLPGIRAVDASVIEHDGLWWMFAGIDGSGQNQNLYVWHARDLTGPWTPHKANPVKTDARSARPGGTAIHIRGAAVQAEPGRFAQIRWPRCHQSTGRPHAGHLCRATCEGRRSPAGIALPTWPTHDLGHRGPHAHRWQRAPFRAGGLPEAGGGEGAAVTRRGEGAQRGRHPVCSWNTYRDLRWLPHASNWLRSIFDGLGDYAKTSTARVVTVFLAPVPFGLEAHPQRIERTASRPRLRGRRTPVFARKAL